MNHSLDRISSNAFRSLSLCASRFSLQCFLPTSTLSTSCHTKDPIMPKISVHPNASFPAPCQSPSHNPSEKEANDYALANVSYTKRKNVNSWTRDEDLLLAEGVRLNLCWVEISRLIAQRSRGLYSRSAEQCSQRWSRTLNPNIRKGVWLDSEIQLLNEAVQLYGTKSWSLVSRHVKNRTDIQCRTRYMQERQREALASQLSSPSLSPSMNVNMCMSLEMCDAASLTGAKNASATLQQQQQQQHQNHQSLTETSKASSVGSALSFFAAVAVEFDSLCKLSRDASSAPSSDVSDTDSLAS